MSKSVKKVLTKLFKKKTQLKSTQTNKYTKKKKYLKTELTQKSTPKSYIQSLLFFNTKKTLKMWNHPQKYSKKLIQFLKKVLNKH